jgi:hypothetical protein
VIRDRNQRSKFKYGRDIPMDTKGLRPHREDSGTGFAG